MNVASVTVRAMSHGLYFGFQGASNASITFFFLNQEIYLKTIGDSLIRHVWQSKALLARRDQVKTRRRPFILQVEKSRAT
jgi:hypothetical protein